MIVGIVGKPSSGKSTFLNALTMVGAKTGDYPFTTVDPNRGTAYVKSPCVCQNFDVTCNPKNSICKDGIRYLPIQILDVAGLVPGASEGRGLGNKFLDDLRQADVLIHIVDISGSLDAEGNSIKKGTWDPIDDIKFLEKEIDAWIYNIIMREFKSMKKKASAEKLSLSSMLTDRLSGLKITKPTIENVIRETDIINDDPKTWEENLSRLVTLMRKKSKPIVIVANKIDQQTAEKNLERVRQYVNEKVFPTSALAEVVLRQEVESSTISYVPGESDFTIIAEEKLSEQKKILLHKIKENILKKYSSTGVQDVIDYVVYEKLDLIVAYPVEDISRLADKDGNVLPDAFLIPKGTTAKEFAEKIHTDLAESFIHGKIAPTGRRIGADYEIEHNDIIKIVAATK